MLFSRDGDQWGYKDQRMLGPSGGWRQKPHPCYFSSERGPDPELRGSWEYLRNDGLQPGWDLFLQLSH